MKKIILSVAIAFFAVASVNAQLRKVPAEVTDAFKQKFPSASGVSWKDKLSSFQATFTDNGQEMKAWFSKEEGWKETEIKKEFDDLPAAVKDGFSKSKYNTDDWERGSVAEVIKKDGTVQYRIFVEKNLVSKKFLFFSKEGQLQKENLGV
ncbi:PepSY-like domain-containing protein [Foetidibacter luteolus]|uniref:PepSY-like domain-containing protein n=1 Tax=Foetidibacter luteolus TaxID=2608880 RepID=UPI00129A5687|nr:PepSY-like domain-containing protein [Foetidibacter luteolus]